MTSVDFPSLEREILDLWQRERCFERLVEQNRGKPRWSFLDGPITANNPMGVHHAWGRTYKDIFQRFHAMTGHELRYQNGFDCQGLWVEVEVEKDLGFGSKRDIEAYGIAKFVEKCKQRVLKYAAIQTAQSQRLGYWMDWDHSYYTMSDENNYTIWQFLRRCHAKGYIYHGWDSMPWCPRCGTGISQHEISNEERPEVVHRSPTVKLPLRGRPGEFLLIWTTTPWTLPANVAAAVHPDLPYLKVRQGGEIYYLQKDRLAATMAGETVEVLEEGPGARMAGWPYVGPFDELPAQHPDAHKVVLWKEVTTTEGTGIVHIAPGCGREDYRLGRALGLPAIAPIDEFGIFVEGFGEFTGKEAASVVSAVHRSLAGKGLLYRTEDYRHAYPICWRCKTQLLFRLVDEWYIRMDELRHEIIRVTGQTDWIPEVGRQLEIEWLHNMQDWMISKKRYWGLALPIYYCQQCDAFEVLGSRDELQARAVTGWEEFEGHSPHRPYIDAVHIECGTCRAEVSRIPDVGNPWLDAGIVPYSTMHYGTDRAYWEKWFPADWISESFPGQFRNWFYAILAMSTVMENRPPFKLMFGYRLMKDAKGEEMHKSKGNAVDFNSAAEQEGADAMRWLFASHNPEHDLWFGTGKIRDARRQLLVLWNVFEFFAAYAELDRFVPLARRLPLLQRSDLDRWILYLLDRLVASARKNLGSYAAHLLMRDVNEFIDALSRWYLRRSRRRFWRGGSDAGKAAAYQTLWECLVTVVELLAPITPFAAEAMYQRLVRRYDGSAPTSVHLRAFPEVSGSPIDEELLGAMDAVRVLAEQGQAARSKAGLKVRQPLAGMRVVALSRPLVVTDIEALFPLLAEELNVREIHFVDSGSGLYTLSAKLNARTANPKYGRLAAELAKAMADRPAMEIATLLHEGKLDLEVQGQTISLQPEDVVVEREAAEGWAIAEGGGFLVALDTRLTEELRREGRVRDLVRHIQSGRKEMGLAVSDRIRIRYQAPDELSAIIEAASSYLAEETLAVEVLRSAAPLATEAEVDLGFETLRFTIERA